MKTNFTSVLLQLATSVKRMVSAGVNKIAVLLYLFIFYFDFIMINFLTS